MCVRTAPAIYRIFLNKKRNKRRNLKEEIRMELRKLLVLGNALLQSTLTITLKPSVRLISLRMLLSSSYRTT